jgi:putative DNA primase/helicase
VTWRPEYLNDEDEFPKVVPAAQSRGGVRPKSTVELVAASTIQPVPIEWIWQSWLARGRLHLLAGQPGAGKTTLALAFAAIKSSGGVWPDGARANPERVVIWSGEDDRADTLVPRLIAAGATRAR